MKQFFNKAILTTKNPESFLNFQYDGNDYFIIPDCCIGLNMLYVNGLDVNKYLGDPSLNFALKLNSTQDFASFHIYSNVNYNFDTNLRFNFYDPTLTFILVTHDVSVLNRPYIINDSQINSFENKGLINNDDISHMLLRTNPKLTGNIKLVIDTSNNLYLDTFQVSDELSNKKYRKQQVSANSVLSSDIYTVFKTLPKGELYRVDVDNTLVINVPKTELKKQFLTTYNYGARLLRDDLYTQDNGILAPLWINNTLPDYFSIFRLEGNYNQETYDDSPLDNLAVDYIKNSNLIKSWSLKPTSNIGKYLNTHLNNIITSKSQNPVFLSLTDPSSIESDYNSWFGIATDADIIAERSETTYNFNTKSTNFTNLNSFITDGFSRNNLVSSNLINLEFIFDDNDVNMYSMNRYFGLYLKENELYNIAYYSDSSLGTVQILSLDDKDSSVFLNSTIFDANGDVSTSFTNRIFVLNDGTSLTRITNLSQINISTPNYYTSKPYNNIFSTAVEKLENVTPFVTLKLNKVLTQGEHLRIINKTESKIWEIYGVDVSNYYCEKYCTTDTNVGYPTIYRTFFNTNNDVEDQILEIQNAFDSFSDYDGTYFRAGVHGSDWITILLDSSANMTHEWQFQRITASTLSNSSSSFNTAGKCDDITYFGRFTPTEQDFEVVTFDASYGPIGFELYGNRKSMTFNLLNPVNKYVYSFDVSQNILDKIEDPTLYQDTSLWYQKIVDLDISVNSNIYSYQYMKDPVNFEDKVIIITNNKIQTIRGIYNAYNIYPLSISIMGIIPVSDIDYTVYDSSILNYTSNYFYNRENDLDTYKLTISGGDNYILSIKDSFTVLSGTGNITQNGVTSAYTSSSLFNTFDSSVYISATTNTIISYADIDGTYTYQGYNSTKSEENLGDYYDSSILLKYGLTIPLTSKWVGLGTDCRNNPYRLMLNNQMFDSGIDSNFIPTSTQFNQEITYPSFKYLSDGNDSWKDYVFYDINDVIYDGSTYSSFKELMFANPTIDYFSKLVYSNYNVNGQINRSTTMIYNDYKDSLNTLFLGLNLSFQINDTAKNLIDIKTYNKYRFSFISSASKNTTSHHPLECFINENTKTILLVWYQGNDELNYNRRYSSYLPGKSLLDTTNSGFMTNDASYCFVKTPFYLNTSTVNLNLINLYDNETTYDSSTARPYAQFNKSLLGYSSVLNTFGDTNITPYGYVYPDLNKIYNTFDQKVQYSYTANSATYRNKVANYGYKYNSNENLYLNNTTNYDTLNSLIAHTHSNIMFHIIKENSYYNNYVFGNITPLTLTINPPTTYRSLKVYNGYFKPKFNNILNFKFNEDSEIINVVEQDFISGNTNLISYNHIPQLWYNKVVTNITATDISTGNAISYIENFNVFKSLWDAEYFVRNNQIINGYECPEELPSFFGSKLVKLPDQLILDSWTSLTATSINPSRRGREVSENIIVRYNLTQAILNKFKSNSQFINNWSNFSNTDNSIDNYIKTTILSYYNLSVQKINLELYYKPYSSQLIYYTHDSNFILNTEQNVNTQMIYENNEYFYQITLPKNANFSYYAKIILIEK